MKHHNLFFVFAFLLSSFLNEVQAREIPLPTSASIDTVDVIDSDLFSGTLALIPINACDGETINLDGVHPLAFTYEWLFENPIGSGTYVPFVPAETASTLNVTITGNYRVLRFRSNGTSLPDIDYEVVFSPTPVANPADDLLSCDDGINTGVFDLTLNTPLIRGGQDPLIFEVLYFDSFFNSDNNLFPIPIPTAHPIAGTSQTIYARIHNILNNDCYDLTDFIIEFPPITIGVMTDMDECDVDADGTILLDLFALKNGEALGGQLPSDYTVSYHPTPGDADANTNAHSNPYSVTIPLETIYVRVENNSSPSCYATASFTVTVTPSPQPVTPTPYILCDEIPNNGFAVFDLTTKDAEITGGNINVSPPTYHESLTAANDGAPIISGPTAYTNIVPGFQIVYVRLESTINTSCYNVVELQLQVNPAPVIADPISDYPICDNDGNGTETYDLLTKETEILNGLPPADYTITYHNSQADAEAGVPFIAAPGAYPSGGETIWVRVENNLTNCWTVGSFNLVLNPPPIFNIISPVEECDDPANIDGITEFDLNTQNDAITGGDTNLSVTYHATQADADAGAPLLTIPYANTTPNTETIYVRIENITTGCFGTYPMVLIVTPPPIIVQPTPMQICDDNNDGIGVFALGDADAEVVSGAGGGGNLTVSYHISLTDAQSGIFPLPKDIYENFVPYLQTVHVRLFDSITGCYNLTTLDLIVLDSPQIIQPTDIRICDDDGFAIFDLTIREDEILNGLPPTDYTITYFVDIGLTNQILNPTNYTNISSPQTIYVLVGDNNNVCRSVTSLRIWADIIPAIIQPTPFIKCDDLGEPNDGITIFNLTEKTFEITGGALGVTVTYYTTEAAAQSGNEPIDPDTAYENISNPETIWIRVTDNVTLCAAYGINFFLQVEPNPEPGIPEPMQVCDDNEEPGLGQEEFDLTEQEAVILNGNSWDLTYHLTYEGAVDGLIDPDIINPIFPYTNVSSPQIIYVRVTIDISDPDSCFEIVELQLIVNLLPETDFDIDPYIICETDSDGIASFDLTTKIDEILNGQFPLLFDVTFYESQGFADLMINEIDPPEDYTNLFSGQTIYVGILNNVTGCYTSAQSFILEVREGAIANPPLEPYSVCDEEPFDGIADFDLTDPLLVGEILGTQDPGTYLLEFYETFENAEAEIDALPSIYTNIINPQIVYVRVTNTNTDCFDIAEVILKVETPPIIFLEDTYRLCVDENGNPLPEESGALSPPIIDTGFDPLNYIFEWELNGQVLGEFGPSIIAIQEGVYTVTVIEISSACSSTASTTVVLSSPPLIYDAVVTSEAFANIHNIIASAEGLGTYEFQLNNGPFQDNGNFFDIKPGNHTITISDVNGCGSVTIDLGVIDYPRVVTPNQDGFHDTWNITGIAFGDPTAKIYIFDRFGKLLKEVTPQGEGWDGTYNGNPLPSSDYWFRIEYTENDIRKEYRGHFTLKR